MPLSVQGQLKRVDQEALSPVDSWKPDNPWTRAETESGIGRTIMVLDSQRTKSVPRGVRLALEKNIDEVCPDRNPQSRIQHENLDVRSVETTRLLREVALFDETCDLTDEDAQEATVRACRSVNPGQIIVGIPRTASKSHFEFCMTLCTWEHERGALYIMILTDFRGCTFRGTVLGARNTAPERRECLARTGSTTSGDGD